MTSRRLRSLHDIDWVNPLYLYGCGAGGLAFLLYCRLARRDVAGFLDSGKSGEASGLPVLAVDDYFRRLSRPDNIIVVTSHAHAEIGHRLDILGLRHWNGYALAAALAGEARRFDDLMRPGVLRLDLASS